MFLLVYLVEKQKIGKLHEAETVKLIELETIVKHKLFIKVMLMNLIDLYSKMVEYPLQLVIDGTFIVCPGCHLVQKVNKMLIQEIKLLQILMDEVDI